MTMRPLKQLMLLATAALVAACSEPTPPIDEIEFTGGGPTTFRLTDAPFPYDRVARVDIFVVRVTASWAADTTAAASNEFATVANVNRKINLLALEGGLSDVLGTAAIPEGAIKAIRLIIDTDQSSITMKDGSVLTGSSNPGIAWQSSAGIATLNATVEDHISVPVEGTDVVIDFDVGRAFIDPAEVSPPSNHQGFIFSPVLRAAQVSRTGSVSGTVRIGSSTGPAANEATVQLMLGNPNSPANTWAQVATTRTDANGAFKFGFVTRSGFYTQAAWSYMVVATKAGGSATFVNVHVNAGADTPVGSVVVPAGGVPGGL
jgi:hypothetical protein